MTRRVAVLMGGRSSEHEVSLASAEAVIAALDPARDEVIPVLISPDGVWSVEGEPVAMVAGSDGVGCLTSLAGGAARAVDVAFPVLHGPHGEDGTIQGALETAGVPYVGAGVACSAVAMDKAMFKVFLAEAGIPHARARGGDRGRVGARPGRGARPGGGERRIPGVQQAGAPRVERGDQPRAGRGEPGRGPGARLPPRRQGAGGARHPRARDRGRRARRRRPVRLPRRRDHLRLRVVRLRHEVRAGPLAAAGAGGDPGGGGRDGARAGGPRVRGGRLPRAGAGRLLPGGGRHRAALRAQHDARLHPHERVRAPDRGRGDPVPQLVSRLIDLGVARADEARRYRC